MSALIAIFGFLANHWKATALALAIGVPTALAGYWHALYVHEQSAYAKERQSLAAVTARVIAENKRRTDDAEATIRVLRYRLIDALAAVPPRDPRGPLKLVCRAPRQVAAVPGNASPGPGGDAAVRPPASVEGQDVVPSTEAILAAAGARILYLQRYIAEGQRQGFIAGSHKRDLNADKVQNIVP